MLLPAEPPVITAIAHTAFNTVLLSGKVNEGLLTYDFDLSAKPELATALPTASRFVATSAGMTASLSRPPTSPGR